MPKVTVAFLSWNRLHYLKATIESARICIEYPNLEWLLSDNVSDEPGFSLYLQQLGWFDDIMVRRQSHADAMNELVDRATGEYIIIWPDDVQFIVKGRWLQEIIEIMELQQDIGSICLDHMRKSTLLNIFQPSLNRAWKQLFDEFRLYRGKVRRHKEYSSRTNFKLLTMGWMRPGIVGSGIPSLTATRTWRRLGKWNVLGNREEIGLVDSSLGAESDMLQRAMRSRLALQRAAPLIPVAADIVTDPTGCKAKVRSNYRYGVYMPPPDGTFYYKIQPFSEMQTWDSLLPVDFDSGVHPLGFRIPVDKNGERKKTDINTSVVYDMVSEAPVEYPLSHPRLTID